jgi:hypothetical protein
MENSINGARSTAGITVDALVWVDVKHQVALVEAIAGAYDDAIRVLAANTRGGDNVGHL